MKKSIQSIAKQAVCILLCLLILTPVYMVFINSLKTRPESAKMSLSLPTQWCFNNYLEVIEKGKLLLGFSNSMLYAVVSTTVAVITCAMAAFVLCRRKSKMTTFLYFFMMSGLFFPINYVTLIKVLNVAHINNTKLGIIVAFTSAMIPFCIFTIRNFVLSVPVELDEAAVIDGAGPLTLFFKVIMPLLKPTLITCFILEFMMVWSDFLTPLYLSNKSSMFPMNLAVFQFFGKNKSYWNYVFADIILTSLPAVIVYLVGQKYIVGGLTSGAVKE